jgi:glycosyltransferase involved in cell wall biosynthesis
MTEHSVIVPMRNAAPYVRDCLRSALGQLSADDEILVVDNGSTDASVAVVESLSDPRIRLLEEPKPGPSAARNAGLEVSRGRYVTFLDADDMWAPDRLDRMTKALAATPGADAVYGRVQMLYEKGIPEDHGAIDGQYVQNWALWTYMFEHDLVRRVGRLVDELQMGEDTDFILRARRAGMKCAICDAPVSIYRRHSANVTNDRAAVRRSFMRTLSRSAARNRSERTS